MPALGLGKRHINSRWRGAQEGHRIQKAPKPYELGPRAAGGKTERPQGSATARSARASEDLPRSDRNTGEKSSKWIVNNT